MTDAPKLLPCPFCGSKAELWQAVEGRPAWIACMGRCAVLITKQHTTTEAAIETWNTRADAFALGQADMQARAAELLSRRGELGNLDRGEAGRSARAILSLPLTGLPLAAALRLPEGRALVEAADDYRAAIAAFDGATTDFGAKIATVNAAQVRLDAALAYLKEVYGPSGRFCDDQQQGSLEIKEVSQ